MIIEWPLKGDPHRNRLVKNRLIEIATETRLIAESLRELEREALDKASLFYQLTTEATLLLQEGTPIQLCIQF